MGLVSDAENELGRPLEPDERAIAERIEGRDGALAILLRMAESRPPEKDDAELEASGYLPIRVSYLKRGKVRHTTGARKIEGEL